MTNLTYSMDRLKKSKMQRKELKSEITRLCSIIDHMKAHDNLTGLSNYSLIQTQIKKMIECSSNRRLFIILLGLDNFNLINEAMGHSAGDQLLCETSERIKHYFGKNSLVSRKFGDEFIIVLRCASVANFTKKIKGLLLSLAKPYLLNTQPVSITASMGVSVYPDDTTEPDVLLRQAEVAFVKSKALGKNNYQFFTALMGEEAHFIRQLQKDLDYSLDRKEFFLCYQPQIKSGNSTLAGFEALLRWNHPDLGLIMPVYFIPIAEKTGHIIPIGEWVLRTACMEAAIWQKIDKPVGLSVNISHKQFRTVQVKNSNRFIDSVEIALSESGLAPNLLELEITENIIMTNDDITKNNLKKLKDLGVRISCDDFGIGYASFNRLKELPFDTLKIDKSLVEDMTKDSVDFAIVRAILTIAQKLKIKTIAEGVETKAQLDLLIDLGCDEIQGNYFSRPLAVEQANKLLL